MKASSRRSSMIGMDTGLSSFSESFYRLFSNLNEDAEESLVSLLEDKVIPKDEEDDKNFKESHQRPKTLMVNKFYENRRSFNRKRRDNIKNSNEDNQFLKTYEYYESLHSPAARRRSSSIAVPQPSVVDQSYALNLLDKSVRATSPKLSGNKKTASGVMQGQQRNRTCSMPVVTKQKPMLSQIKRPEDTDGYYRLRSFSITPNGVCKNLGDCLKTRRSRSSCSVDSSPSILNQRLSGTSSIENSNEIPTFTVGMLGASNVGKTTLSYQFTTSEYICAYDTSLDDEYGRKTVSISLNGQEAEFNIIDIPASEMSVETFCYTFSVDVFVVVYSIIDTKSFKMAEEILLYLWKNDYMSSKGVILVGNKADLERRREISAATGRKLALSWRCKFIETSSGLDHNVDELLVGIFAQVQLNPKRNRSQMKGPMENGKQLFKSILNFGKKSKSCENLFVL